MRNSDVPLLSRAEGRMQTAQHGPGVQWRFDRTLVQAHARDVRIQDFQGNNFEDFSQADKAGFL